MTTKILETLYGVGGFDEAKPNNNVVGYTVAEQQADDSWVVSDETGTHPATADELILIYRVEQ
jgi:hypothetical protein